jgi:pyruvate dehydrogenase E2 component (dihydrolipoamide acetyltransferase)
MAIEVTLPALGESVTEGTVTRWLKQVGDAVAVDEPLLEVSTDKVDTEIPAPVAGTLLAIKAAEDETVEVGAPLAIIGESSEAQAEPASAVPGSGADAASEVSMQAGLAPVPPPPPVAQAAVPAQAAAGQPAAERLPVSVTPVTLPALGESVTEGTVTRWLKQVGDEVAVDEPLLEVSTDKVDTEIPSPVAGRLLEVKVGEDETVEVGAELAVIGSGDAGPAVAAPVPAPAPAASLPAPGLAPAPAAAPAAAPPVAAPPAAAPPAGAPPAAAPPVAAPPVTAPAPSAAPAVVGPNEAGTYVTPLVRKLAHQYGVDLDLLAGSGVGGRIRKQDVIDAVAQAKAAAPVATTPASAGAPVRVGVPPSALRGKTEPLSRLRKVIASRMVESLRVSAQLTTVVEVDVTAISRLRDAVKAEFDTREGVKLSFMPFFAKAAIDTLKEHPQVNASIDTEKGEVTYYDRENIAIAVDSEKGLLTPVIRDAGGLSVSGLARKIADLADRTRNNKITPDELSGGTFTLTNTGSRGALFDTPIINQPQVAILGTGTVVKRPVVIDDANLGETITVRQMVYLSLTYDHRLVDGADAARFLTGVKQRLESGQFEV